MKIFNLLVFTACLMSIPCGLAQTPSYVPSNGLAGWWPFTGNANDLSGNGNNGTVNGATLTTDRFGNPNQAYSFDGVNDYISLASINQLGISNSSFSLSIWVKCSVFGANNNEDYIIGTPMWGGNSDEGFNIQNNPMGSVNGIYSSSLGIGGLVYCSSNNNFSLNTWEHLVIRYTNTSGSFQLFVNGVLLSSSTLIGSPLTNPYPISVGAFVGPWIDAFLSGKTDDIGIWNRALTQQEITNLYNANNGPQASISTPNNSLCAGQSTTLTATVANPGTSCNTAGLPPSLVNGLVGYWPFCGNANDASGNGNNGTVSGATLTNDRFGTANSAYSFNGSSRIDVGTLNNQIGNPNSSWSVNCWFKSAGSQIGDMAMVSDYSSSSGGDQIISTWLVLWSYTFNNKVGSHVRYYPNGWDALSTNSYNDNQWHSLMSVADNGILKIYVDGILITTVTYPANTNFQGSPFFRFGTILFNGQYDSYFQGQLDDIGIWNRALTAQEVSLLYNAGQPAYTWSNGATTPNITVSPTQTTTYSCTITMNGASSVQSQTITVNPLPTVSAGQNQTVCAGTSITLSGSGASSYSWNNNVQNGVAFTPSTTQSYTVTGTDANGCSNTAQTTVTVNALPTVSAGQNQTVCAGTAVTLSGSGASTYSWNNNVQNGVAFTPSTTQSYTVTGTAANGCSNTAQVQVAVNALPNVSAGQNQTVCAGNSVALSGSGAQSYTWNNNVQNGVAFTPNATSTYTVIGTAANGCTNTAQVQVAVIPLPIVGAGANQTVCAGTSVTLSGSGAQSYTWNNNVQNSVAFTPNATSTYTVIGTAANGCTNTAQVTVTVNALPIVSAGQNQAVCAGNTVTLNGSGAQSYTWNNNVQNGVVFTPSTTQSYTVTGLDANGCANTAQVTVTVNALPTVSAGLPLSICQGSNVVLFGSGALNYTWNNGIQNAVPFVPIATQTYTVTGTDANGCTDTDQILVTVNPYPVVSAGTNQTVCAGSSITLNASGALTLVWNNGVTNGVPFSVNQSQTYTVIGNSNGCTDTAQVTVTVNPTPIVSAGQNQSVCAGTSVTLIASGANTYSWNNNVQNGVAFTPSATQSYTVTGIDANGCTNTAQVTVTVNSLPTVSAGLNQAVCAGTSVTLSGTGAITYTWNNNVQNGVAFTPSTTLTYSLVGTDGNGCQGTDQVIVEVLNPSSATLNITECTSYSLNGQTYTQSGIYSQSLTNYVGCDSTITLNLTINNLPVSPVVNTSNDNTLSTASQGNATFQWIFCSTGLAIANETDSVFVPTVNGVYAVSLTNGCGTVTSNCVTIDNMALDEEETYLVIHPNPTWNIVYLKGLEATDKPYELHDLMGRVVAVGNISAAQNAIDMTSFASGTYRLVVKEVGVISIIKQ